MIYNCFFILNISRLAERCLKESHGCHLLSQIAIVLYTPASKLSLPCSHDVA